MDVGSGRNQTPHGAASRHGTLNYQHGYSKDSSAYPVGRVGQDEHIE